ncbi:MAG: translation factor Sua5 [Sphingomonas bacterium]|uniref:L-threonylcarbamoyladenylate synthase n=1 Tax=Sphingomonas bacterium TaxID=1895847 RepID=UPI002629DC65|nr:L-threonylcarbamoyladenylate synthase [Sphingomonas bacterium]MDB5696308.1 translation factor Sua5 [Sphingomonas bacterium]
MAGPTILPFGDNALEQAARLIANGQVVAVPTETVYGLAADAMRADAVARIYAAKGRPSFNPLIVHVLDIAAARRLAVFDERAEALAAAFWPGPLTLVLPVHADARLAPAVTAGLDTVAIRVPAHRAMRALLEATGTPLAAPSANRSGGISPTCAAHVAASLGAAVPLIVDDGECPAGVESTIVAGDEVLRPGPITQAMIAMVLESVPTRLLLPGESGSPGPTSGSRSGAFPPARPTGPRLPPGRGLLPEKVTAPGQLASHYAPNKPLRLNATTAAPDEWLIGFGAVAGDDTLSATGDLTGAAARLFTALHRADASARTKIAVAPVPEDGIGEAINDRLRRAAYRP